VTAKVVKRHVSVGSRVSEGDVFVELDGTLLEIRLDEAKARLKSAEVQLEATEAELQDTEGWDDEDLVRDAKLRYESALAARDLAETQTEEAETIYNSRIVRAPRDGRIAQCWLEAGEFAASGQPVAEMVVTERLKAVVSLTARETLALEGDVLCRAGFQSPQGDMQSAKILNIAPMADPRTKSFSVEVEVDNRNDALQPGLHIDVTFHCRTAKPSLVLPRKAVTWREDSFVCYRVDEEAGAHVVRLVEPVLESLPGRPNVLRVVSGLSAGDEVVVGDFISLENGLAVRPARLERR
jgi:RND family efflux transporter MFP subunit